MNADRADERKSARHTMTETKRRTPGEELNTAMGEREAAAYRVVFALKYDGNTDAEMAGFDAADAAVEAARDRLLLALDEGSPRQESSR